MNARKGYLLLAGLPALAICSIAFAELIRQPALEIAEASQATEISVKNTLQSQSGITIRVCGEIDGEAEVWADNWPHERVTGRVDWSVYHDWFQNDCTLHYKPIGLVTGRLNMSYRFH